MTENKPTSSSDDFDWSTALSGVNDDEDLLREVIEAFLDEGPKLMTQICEAIDQADAPVLRRAAHTLKGSMRFFGAHVAYEQALQLETMGKDQNFDHAGDNLEILKQEMDRLTPILAAYAGRKHR